MVSARASVGRRTIPTNPIYPSEPGFVREMQKRSKYMTDALNEILQSFEDESPEICLEALGPTFELSQKYVPVKDGHLKASGYLEIVSRGRNPRVEIGYAKGGTPDYAVFVHERVDIPHKAPTMAKFLEVAVLEDLDNIEKRLEHGYGALIDA
jgi:hypothetical protein